MKTAVLPVLLAFFLVVLLGVDAKTSHLVGCKDNHRKCHANTDLCHHGTYHLMMVHLCPGACDLCQEHMALKAQCKDKLPNCNFSMCGKPKYITMMKKVCKKTCLQC
ncbi:hypothetical protein M3Y99_01280500 [Aphelenchoides fujianensis]|nr:hypothetical protein M3Y99_01280500 [Aphelenchoides fujianensis]